MEQKEQHIKGKPFVFLNGFGYVNPNHILYIKETGEGSEGKISTVTIRFIDGSEIYGLDRWHYSDDCIIEDPNDTFEYSDGGLGSLSWQHNPITSKQIADLEIELKNKTT